MLKVETPTHRDLTLARRARAISVESLGVIGLLFVTITSSVRLEDLKFWDESSYLERGQTLGFGSLPGWEWSPLYTDGYWFLGKLTNEPIDTYFAGRALSASILVLAVWISLRLFVRSKIALAGGLVMAALPITFVWPGVSNPSTALLLVAFAVMWRWRNLFGAASAVTLLWVASAIRPEFVWAAVCGSLLVAAVLTQRLFAKHISLLLGVLLALLLVAVPTILSLGYGSPLQLGSRSWEAFGQHYELRFATPGDDPWDIQADIVGRDFPRSRSIASAAIENPLAMTAHVTKNALTLVVSSGGHFLGLGGLNRAQNAIGITTAIIWLLTLVFAIRGQTQRLRLFVTHVLPRTLQSSSRLALILTTITVVVSFTSLLIIYPRPHYLGLIVSGLVLLTGFVIDRMIQPKLLKWVPLPVIAGLSTLVVVFNLAAMGADSIEKVNTKSLKTMNQMDIKWRLLTPERPIDLYLKNGIHVLAPDLEATSFAEVLQTNQINVIFDGILFRQADWKDFEDFPVFLDDPMSFGFEPVITGSPFLVRAR